MATFEQLVDQRVRELLPELIKPLQEEIELLKARPNYLELLTTKEAMKMLNVSRTTLLDYWHKGKIERGGAGKVVRYKLSSIENHLKGRCIKPEVLTERLARISA